MCQTLQLFVTLCTVALQASLSMGFSRQEYWSGFPCPSAGDLSDPGIEPASLLSHELASRFSTSSTTWEAYVYICIYIYIYIYIYTLTHIHTYVHMYISKANSRLQSWVFYTSTTEINHHNLWIWPLSVRF